jgi:hypothetical protein
VRSVPDSFLPAVLAAAGTAAAEMAAAAAVAAAESGGRKESGTGPSSLIPSGLPLRKGLLKFIFLKLVLKISNFLFETMLTVLYTKKMHQKLGFVVPLKLCITLTTTK